MSENQEKIRFKPEIFSRTHDIFVELDPQSSLQDACEAIAKEHMQEFRGYGKDVDSGWKVTIYKGEGDLNEIEFFQNDKKVGVFEFVAADPVLAHSPEIGLFYREAQSQATQADRSHVADILAVPDLGKLGVTRNYMAAFIREYDLSEHAAFGRPVPAAWDRSSGAKAARHKPNLEGYHGTLPTDGQVIGQPIVPKGRLKSSGPTTT